MLRSAHAALLASLSRYSLAPVGSGAYDVGLRKLEVQLANISARRIIGAGRSARLAALHITLGVMSVRNLFIRSCALMLDRAMRAYRSTVRTRLGDWLSREMSVQCWCPEVTETQAPSDAMRFFGMRGDSMRRVLEEWGVSLQTESPQLDGRHRVASTYHTPLELT